MRRWRHNDGVITTLVLRALVAIVAATVLWFAIIDSNSGF